MAPLIVLIVVTGIARLIGLLMPLSLFDSWSSATAFGLAAMFLMTGISHFTSRRRAGLVAIVPPWVPAPAIVVSVTGVLEIAGAIALLLPQFRTFSAACLGLLLIAMFPANIYAAADKRHPDAPHTRLLPRTLYQLLYLVAIAVTIWG
ncbi:hypothetical protein [Leifsonia sp. A12D58]|uniref:DoxX family protein n=1 Tax=Leifsonia sp. A12D58 TaxID=3397674 RepID=UPI0039E1D852